MAIANFYLRDGLAWFHLEVKSIADSNASPYEFDGPATLAHVEGYKAEYAAFVAEQAAIYQAAVSAAAAALVAQQQTPSQP